MSIYKGEELISGKIGGVGPPGINSTGGSDMGAKIVPILPGEWLYNSSTEEYTRVITRVEHGMAASPALLAFTAEYNEDFTALEKMGGFVSVGTNGIITLKSQYPWQGVCVVAGGISQAMDAVARQAIQDEEERAEGAENGLQALIEGEEARATEAEAQALQDAKNYTDERIADTVAATQAWLPAVDKAENLPTITDTTKTYLCRVVKDNDVYQCVAGQTAWALYSDNTDYIDEEELADAIEVEETRATQAESALGTRITKETAKRATFGTAGTNTAYTLTSDALPTSLTNGLTVEVVPHVNSGANPTLNLNGTGAKPVYVVSTSGEAHRAFNKLVAGVAYPLTYNATLDGWVVLPLSYPDYSEVANTPPLYTATGQNEDGSMTQKAITDAINTLAAGAFVPYVATPTWSGSAGNYTYTLAASVHGKGTTPLVTTYENGALIDCSPSIDSAGNITLHSNTNLSNIKMEVR